MAEQSKGKAIMRKTLKISSLVLAVIIGILLIAVLISFINHKVKLNQESELFKPLGKMVTVDGHSMSVYTGGKGKTTLVFLAGGGTASPILDFKSLYSRLSDSYRIAVPERIGYGFSDVADTPRDIDTVLDETRKALKLAGEKPPYILFPHSMSGLEAEYWAQKYPNEVSAIVGLDPAVPAAYGNIQMPKTTFVFDLFSLGAKMGVTRFIPSMINSEPAIKGGTLTNHEKDIYKAVFYRRTETKPMINELESVKANAQKVNEMPPPQVPMLFFTSNGAGTGIAREEWQHYQKDYLSKVNNSQQILLDCGHYVQDFKYETIATHSKIFINSLVKVK
ncbi:pimeloyl-ACP methyl ester carboxylesterase [Pullulanibacillus pueri]|uniref:Alpha/beta hydrolase n=1 Tax=Pullulanibacillus pueri TaxID=1437324 RepID=A0A8J2ZSE0_9BACL|nr:alpha/beta hydrolase [Pullulanibacillus pueri]MBM7679944.1 pimeloyl-ACP methyl ester carboxylesterase [Pullulanibacillus pueri]GGH73612.1 alpha/beta hydrolase [Pullulanibacillus pueri]